MKIAPTVAGSSLTFALVVLRDIFVYLKHKRRRVKDLIEDFKDLNSKVDNILASWKDINDDIESQPTSFQANNQWGSYKRDISRIQYDFENLACRYKSLSGILETMDIDVIGLNEVSLPQVYRETDNKSQSRASVLESDTFKVSIRDCHTNIGPIGEVGSDIRRSVDQTIINVGRTIDMVEQKLWTRKFFKLARLDKEVIKLMARVDAVKKELILKNLTSQVKPRVVQKMYSEELGDFISPHQKYLDELMQCLDNETCKRIGIWGAPGVGITNILKNLNNCLDVSSALNWDVEYVIWLDAGSSVQEKIIENLQEEIIERLKIPPVRTIKGNANIISSALCNKKYILLVNDYHILVKLEDIGIYGEHKYGKVVLGTKSERDLRNVKLDKTIMVHTLKSKEAFKFFKHFIVDYDGLSPEHREMSNPILRSIGGLPGLVKSTAQYLNDNRGLQHWKGIKDKSQSAVGIPRLLGLGGLLESYKRAYENLNEDELKKCLLYATLFPSRYKILRNVLVECWKAEDFYDCHCTTLDAAWCQAMIIFTELEKSCLLEYCNEKYVKMSVFFRKVAFHIPFPNEGDKSSCVYSISGENENLGEIDWNNVRRVSLIRKDIKCLPSSPKCYDLSTLLVQLNPSLTEIKKGFFVNMKNLRVLDLHSTGIKFLPDSISVSKSLRNLYLSDCNSLTKLPPTIVHLTKLEVLDIRGTSITCLEIEILKLKGLRSLQISFTMKDCNKINKSKPWNIFKASEVLRNQAWLLFPPNMYTNLPHLEELTIDFKGDIANDIGEMIKGEVAQFQIGNKFKHNLSPYSSQFSQSSQEAQEPSYLAEQLTTRTFQSTSIVQQHNYIERSRSTLDDEKDYKGKTIANTKITRKKENGKPVNRYGGIRIKEPSEVNVKALATSDEEGDSPHGENWKNKYQKPKAEFDIQLLKNLNNPGFSKLDSLGGEATSSQ